MRCFHPQHYWSYREHAIVRVELCLSWSSRDWRVSLSCRSEARNPPKRTNRYIRRWDVRVRREKDFLLFHCIHRHRWCEQNIDPWLFWVGNEHRLFVILVQKRLCPQRTSNSAWLGRWSYDVERLRNNNVSSRSRRDKWDENLHEIADRSYGIVLSGQGRGPAMATPRACPAVIGLNPLGNSISPSNPPPECHECMSRAWNARDELPSSS